VKAFQRGEGERFSREETDSVGRRRGAQSEEGKRRSRRTRGTLSGEGESHSWEKERDAVGRTRRTQSGVGEGHCLKKERDTVGRRRDTESGEEKCAVERSR